jgi:hypothetical protein
MCGMSQAWRDKQFVKVRELKEDVTRAMKALYDRVVSRDEHTNKDLDKF